MPAPGRKNRMGQVRQVATPQMPRRRRAVAAPKSAGKGRKQAKQPRVPRAALLSMVAFNPKNKMIPPILVPQLGVFPIQGTIRKEPVQAINTSYFLIATSIPGRGTVACFGSYNTAGGVAIPYVATPFEIWSMPLLTLSGHAGGATSSRCTKVGIRVSNASANLYLGGRVYISNLDQRIRFPADPAAMTATQWVTTFENIRGLPEPMTIPATWKSFGEKSENEDKSFYSRVVDEVKYSDFAYHDGISPDATDFFDHIATWTTGAEESRPMSSVVFSWSAPSNATFLQDLTINVDAQFLTRWPIDTVAGQHAITVAAAPQKVVSESR